MTTAMRVQHSVLQNGCEESFIHLKKKSGIESGFYKKRIKNDIKVKKKNFLKQLQMIKKEEKSKSQMYSLQNIHTMSDEWTECVRTWKS